MNVPAPHKLVAINPSDADTDTLSLFKGYRVEVQGRPGILDVDMSHPVGHSRANTVSVSFYPETPRGDAPASVQEVINRLRFRNADAG